jgi:hypothetical protein
MLMCRMRLLIIIRHASINQNLTVNGRRQHPAMQTARHRSRRFVPVLRKTALRSLTNHYVHEW